MGAARTRAGRSLGRDRVLAVRFGLGANGMGRWLYCQAAAPWVMKSRVRNFVPLKSGPILMGKRLSTGSPELDKRNGIKRVALVLI
jgi:hypothetical protein